MMLRRVSWGAVLVVSAAACATAKNPDDPFADQGSNGGDATAGSAGHAANVGGGGARGGGAGAPSNGGSAGIPTNGGTAGVPSNGGSAGVPTNGGSAGAPSSTGGSAGAKSAGKAGTNAQGGATVAGAAGSGIAGADAGDDGGAAGSGGTVAGGSGGTDGALPTGTIRISEIYVARFLEGDAAEWVELSGPPGADLSHISLRFYSTEGSGVVFDVAVADDGGAIGPSGFWSVGGEQSPATDATFSIADPDNWGLDDAGSLQLYRTDDGTWLDTVSWGDWTGGDAPDAPHVPTTLGPSVALPSDDQVTACECANCASKCSDSCPSGFSSPSCEDCAMDSGCALTLSRHGATNDSANDFCVTAPTADAAPGACL